MDKPLHNMLLIISSFFVLISCPILTLGFNKLTVLINQHASLTILVKTGQCNVLTVFVVCRSVKASHVLISADGQVCMSGLRSIFSLIRHGQRAKVVHDFPQYSVKVLPWLSPEVLQQVQYCIPPQSSIMQYCLLCGPMLFCS